MAREPPSQEIVAAVRRFNRFYTRRIGVLERSLLQSRFTLTEGRVIWEIAHRAEPVAAEIGEDLGFDRGYLSRLLASLIDRHLVRRKPSPGDRRRLALELTPTGRRALEGLDTSANSAIEELLGPLAPIQRSQLVEAIGTAQALLDVGGRKATITLRRHRPGDLGWIVYRHGVLYASELGWDERFEGLVAEVAARFLEHHEPARERCFIAEQNGRRVGLAMVVAGKDGVAKLRLLLVEPEARGIGLGARLVDACVRFARGAGYRSMTLWTTNVLHSARRLYEEAGFVRIKTEKHDGFGPRMIGETWSLDLQDGTEASPRKRPAVRRRRAAPAAE